MSCACAGSGGECIRGCERAGAVVRRGEGMSEGRVQESKEGGAAAARATERERHAAADADAAAPDLGGGGTRPIDRAAPQRAHAPAEHGRVKERRCAGRRALAHEARGAEHRGAGRIQHAGRQAAREGARDGEHRVVERIDCDNVGWPPDRLLAGDEATRVCVCWRVLFAMRDAPRRNAGA